MSKMSGVLMLLFVFATHQVMGRGLPSSEYEDAATILSIDGDGIKGIIPGVILQYLETALQKKSKNSEARIADYFDVISGTNTGGLMTAMLATPNHNHRPLFSAPQIVSFYKQESPSIFNQSTKGDGLLLPKYDGKYLHETIREKLNETLLNQTLTNIVIPTFDLMHFRPVLFSSLKVKGDPDHELNVNLSDICIGTSAASIVLPTHHFKHGDSEFNLADGGLAANNPTKVAISEVVQKEKKSKFVVLSLGTGTSKETGGYNESLNWGYLDWTFTGALNKSIDAGISYTADYYISTLFQALDEKSNYFLRVQKYDLDEAINTSDEATPEILNKLEEAGNKLLKENVTIMNIQTFEPEPQPAKGTNEQALDRLAEILIEIKQHSLAKRATY